MIDPSLACFLEEGLGIHLGVSDAGLEPQGARAIAATVDADGAHLTVYLATVAAARLRPALQSNGRVAVSFGRPIDDRACQVKGELVGISDADAGARPAIEAQWQGYLTNLAQIGIPRAVFAGWTMWPATAIRLRVTALFEQTPGPDAGARLP
ncbi:MAG: hypothetical protein Q8L86_08480 [Vicinamibacterales bacterium]|nr:hypothetical protein [Vicinamibacterales bacterium]